MPINSFLLHIKSLTDNLIAIGEKIDSKNMIVYVLSGFNHRYNPFVESITSRSGYVSWEELHSRLLTYKHHLNQQDKDEESHVFQANLAKFRAFNFQSKNQFLNNNQGSLQFSRKS